MRYEDGEVKIYTVTNSAQNGSMPVETLTLASTHRYRQETIGVTRYYQALQADQSISRLIAVPDWPNIKTGDVAKMNSETEQFSITFIQQVYDEDNIKQTKLTLERIDNGYAIG